MFWFSGGTQRRPQLRLLVAVCETLEAA